MFNQDNFQNLVGSRYEKSEVWREEGKKRANKILEREKEEGKLACEWENERGKWDLRGDKRFLQLEIYFQNYNFLINCTKLKVECFLTLIIFYKKKNL